MKPACECCDAPKLQGRFWCGCMDAILCRTCNHCLKHCVCVATAEVDLPYPEQVATWRREWMEMGVKV